MKIKNVKLIIFVLVFVFLVSTFVIGCSRGGDIEEDTSKVEIGDTGNNKQDESGDNLGQEKVSTKNGLPIVDEPTELSLWVPMYGNARKIMKDYNENEVYKELEKRTGIHIKFIHPAAGQESEQFNLMIASKELPDMISQYTASYPGGVDKAIEDNMYLRLNELIDKYAPNFKKIRESNEEIARQTITDKGNIWSFPCIQTDEEMPWWGLIIRKDWLDEVGKEVPTTIDEWYDVLTAFKDQKGVSAPLLFPTNGLDWGGAFVGAYNIGPGFYKIDNKVKYGLMEPGYRDYLATIKQWYDEGLIDKDFSTRDDKSFEAMMTGSKAGACITAYGVVLVYNSILKEAEPKAEFVAVPYPSLNKDEKVHYRQLDNFSKGCETVITSACKTPEIAVQWLDYAYGDEGALLFNYGIENVSYKMVDGKPQFTELITNNPDGLAYPILAWKYKLHMGPYKRNWRAFSGLEEVQSFMETWFEAETDYVMPPVQRTDEESREYSNIMAEVNTFADEQRLKFIMGVESLDNYNKYVEQLRKMNIERAIEIQQAALDRYNNCK